MILFSFSSHSTHDTRTLIISEFVGTKANSCANKRKKTTYTPHAQTAFGGSLQKLFFFLFSLCFFFFLLPSAMYWGCIFVEMMTFKNKKRRLFLPLDVLSSVRSLFLRNTTDTNHQSSILHNRKKKAGETARSHNGTFCCYSCCYRFCCYSAAPFSLPCFLALPGVLRLVALRLYVVHVLHDGTEVEGVAQLAEVLVLLPRDPLALAGLV